MNLEKLKEKNYIIFKYNSISPGSWNYPSIYTDTQYLFFTGNRDVKLTIFGQVLDGNVNLTTALNISYKIKYWSKDETEKELEVSKDGITKSTVILDSQLQLFKFNKSIEVKDVEIFTVLYKYTHSSGSNYSLQNESMKHFKVEYLS